MSGGGVICITGRPASGKSTLGARVVRLLLDAGVRAALLDGDELRTALVPSPGYTPSERESFYATLTRVAAMLERQGLWVVVPATFPLRKWREQLRQSSPRFVEVFIEASQDECEARDAKGLYARFHQGLAPDLPGMGAPYEAPAAPDVVAHGGLDEEAATAAVRLATSTAADPG